MSELMGKDNTLFPVVISCPKIIRGRSYLQPNFNDFHPEVSFIARVAHRDKNDY